MSVVAFLLAMMWTAGPRTTPVGEEELGDSDEVYLQPTTAPAVENLPGPEEYARYQAELRTALKVTGFEAGKARLAGVMPRAPQAGDTPSGSSDAPGQSGISHQSEEYYEYSPGTRTLVKKKRRQASQTADRLSRVYDERMRFLRTCEQACRSFRAAAVHARWGFADRAERSLVAAYGQIGAALRADYPLAMIADRNHRYESWDIPSGICYAEIEKELIAAHEAFREQTPQAIPPALARADDTLRQLHERRIRLEPTAATRPAPGGSVGHVADRLTEHLAATWCAVAGRVVLKPQEVAAARHWLTAAGWECTALGVAGHSEQLASPPLPAVPPPDREYGESSSVPRPRP